MKPQTKVEGHVKNAAPIGKTLANLSKMMPSEPPVQCPNCFELVPVAEIKKHLRNCEVEFD
jgi:hypothetical protein